VPRGAAASNGLVKWSRGAPGRTRTARVTVPQLMLTMPANEDVELAVDALFAASERVTVLSALDAYQWPHEGTA